MDLSIWPLGTPANATVALQRFESFGWVGQFWIVAFWIGLLLCIAAVVTTLMFEKQRKFPTCMCTVLCAVDGIQWGKELVKFSNYGPLAETMVWQPTESACAILFLWNVWAEAAFFVCNVSLAVIIYLAVVKKIDVSYSVDKRYCWVIMIVFFLYTTIFTVVMGDYLSKIGYSLVKNSCTPNNTLPSTVSVIQTFVAIIIEIVLIGAAVRYPSFALSIYAINVASRVKTTSENHTNGAKKLYIKFGVIIVLQTVPRILYTTYYLVLSSAVAEHESTQEQLLKLSIISPIVVLTSTFCFWANAMYVMVDNKPFRDALAKGFGAAKLSLSSFSDTFSLIPRKSTTHNKGLLASAAGFSVSVSGDTSPDVSIELESV